MRKQHSILIQAGLVLATMASGATLFAPEAVAQASASPSHKKASSTSSSHSHSSTTSPASSRTGKSSVKSSTPGASGSKSGKSSSKKPGKTHKVKGQAAPSPERINEIQDALTKRGMYTGETTGKWDDSTSEAMRKFQTKSHLNPTGKLDAPTLQKLGLGSETAGVAAPTPPPNSAANRLLSKNAPKDPEPSDDN